MAVDGLEAKGGRMRRRMPGGAGGVTEEMGGPVRRCIVSGEVRPKDDLIRFVVGPGGRIVPDIEETLPGRGLWLSARRDIVETACARKLFAKAARSPARAPIGLADLVEHLLLRRCLDILGLARRAGRAVVGFEPVRGWLREGRAGLLLAAADAAAGGRAKLRALAPRLALIEVFSGAELGLALGRERAVHVAVAPGRLAERLVREASRLAEFRGATAEAPEAVRAVGNRQDPLPR